MLADFDELITKSSTAHPVPKEVLQALNMQFPDNFPFQYADTGGGKCHLIPVKSLEDVEMRIQVKGLRILDKFPPEVKTQKDLLDYMYRTQTSVHGEIVNGELPQLLVNGIAVDLLHMENDAFEDTKIEGNFQVLISPSPFPELPPIPLEAAGYTMELPAKRVPCAEKDTVQIQAGGNLWVTVDMTILLQAKRFHANWNVDYKKCRSVQEYIQALKMTNAMVAGHGKLMHMLSEPSGKQPPHEEAYIAFWENAAKVEAALGVSFQPAFHLQNEDVSDITRLMRCLVEKRPMKRTTTEGSDIKLTLTSSDPGPIRDALGQSAVVSYTEETTWTLLGATFRTITLVFVLDATFDEIIEEDTDQHQYIVCLKPADGKHMTIASQDFLSQESLDRFSETFPTHAAQVDYFSQATALGDV